MFTEVHRGEGAANRTASYLRPNVKIEPLIHRWHAWISLISPATRAMNIAHRYIPNLKSFVSNPSVHVAATKDPALLGGPFLALGHNDVASAKALLDSTNSRCHKLLRFAEEYKKLDRRLQETATGAGLDPYYQSLPDELAGLVELTYDLNNHPSIKIIEELLYEADADPGHEICLHMTSDEDREFFMSTPMLDRHGRVFLDLKFDDPRLDELSMARFSPVCVEELAGMLEVRDVDLESFRELFTPEPPSRISPEYNGEKVRLRYFGHACVLLQTAEVSVLIDPFLAWRRDDGHATLTFADLPDRIDYVVVTHAHHDHFMLETLLQLRDRIGQVVVPRNARGRLADPSMELALNALGYRNCITVEPFKSLVLPGGEIMSLPFSGEHCSLDIASKHCVSIRLGGRHFAFFVDTDGVDPVLYQRLAGRLGRIDALFMGMECHGAPLSWLYGPLLSRPLTRRDDDSRRLSGSDCQRGLATVRNLDCSNVFVYAMGQESWLKYVMGLAYESDSVQLQESSSFIEECRKDGLTADRLFGCREIFF
ncbi:MBL fold metallo-hydrolase [Xanthomonas arboricola]|uniref:MBL fold metallo-hydrolase n=1 Tax=Xanthomonas arboricola TaxID=56448 RepID=UPI000CEE2056|nr:MBL fold metallo-hydrolase [Xanthomonas arboricola]PPT26471.1 hypothetical protein XarbCFBP7614_15840 [Xanthomonas arboricola]